jgi:DinB superfamily
MSDPIRYPVGPYVLCPDPSPETIQKELIEMAGSPAALRAAVEGLSNKQLLTPYRPGGWMLCQVVHHLAEAHMNWYSRTKLTLTEERPVVPPWDENTWAELADGRTVEIEPALALFEAVCARWVTLMTSLTPALWKREMQHPTRGVFVLDSALGMHVWHASHHTAHITDLRKRLCW